MRQVSRILPVGQRSAPIPVMEQGRMQKDSIAAVKYTLYGAVIGLLLGVMTYMCVATNAWLWSKSVESPGNAVWSALFKVTDIATAPFQKVSDFMRTTGYLHNEDLIGFMLLVCVFPCVLCGLVAGALGGVVNNRIVAKRSIPDSRDPEEDRGIHRVGYLVGCMMMVIGGSWLLLGVTKVVIGATIGDIVLFFGVGLPLSAAGYAVVKRNGRGRRAGV